jgi:hypothetical protein
VRERVGDPVPRRPQRIRAARRRVVAQGQQASADLAGDAGSQRRIGGTGQ